MFAGLGFILLTRRMVYPRVLELTEKAILFPHGFPRTRVTRILYSEIIRVFEAGTGADAALFMGTSKGSFEIWASHLAGVKSYREVRDYISARTSIEIPRWKERQSASEVEGPKPILRWTEPEDWPRFRTELFTSRPLGIRLAQAAWFFARCLAVFVVPWGLLRVFQVETAPTGAFVGLCVVVALFFTVVYYWLQGKWPVHRTEITVRENGITQFFGKQIWDRSYNDIAGWKVIERSVEGRALHILLLKWRSVEYMWAIALPDLETRERLIEILREKGIEEDAELWAPWEEGKREN